MIFWINKIYRLEYKKNEINFLRNNFNSIYIRFSYWQFFFLGFYFDEFFAKGLKNISIKLFMLPSYFFLDKVFSAWIGAGFFKRVLTTYGNFFFLERLDFYFYFLILLLLLFNFIYLYLVFSFI